jgi:hypothetical protein
MLELISFVEINYDILSPLYKKDCNVDVSEE